ncbi:MAG: (2Fe-2S) ferredoxin domain-containing protein [Candidatus Uhrbacteria bacterium]|nr:(2Fe-2S) ferredoxin domain-containing protein [Candidatus Uhrbacteria bacterium]
MKKIAVCHGKSCGPAGAGRIQERLAKKYASRNIEVTGRTCCGRCEHHISIEINDDIVVSDLSLNNLDEKFINDPQSAIARARKEQKSAMEKLDSVLDDIV